MGAPAHEIFFSANVTCPLAVIAPIVLSIMRLMRCIDDNNNRPEGKAPVASD